MRHTKSETMLNMAREQSGQTWSGQPRRLLKVFQDKPCKLDACLCPNGNNSNFDGGSAFAANHCWSSRAPDSL